MPDQYTALSTAVADRYRLEQEIGQGGMATVYLAEDLRHSRELFYRAESGARAMMTAATVSTSPRLAISARRTLFSVAEHSTATPHSNYAVSPDGKTFAMVGFNQASRIVVIQNLPGLVRRLRGDEGAGRR